jgi:hypothetical protein
MINPDPFLSEPIKKAPEFPVLLPVKKLFTIANSFEIICLFVFDGVF